MPSTVVHVAFAFAIAAALLGDYYDRRALGVVLVVLVAPELDTVAGLWLPGAHRALGHTVVVPAAVGILLAYDTLLREESALRGRVGDRGVHLAWVGLFVHLTAHLLLDYAHLDGINVFYPLVDRFVRLEGEAYLAGEGFVQTFVEIERGETGTTVDAGGGGTTADTHVSSPVDPGEHLQSEDPEEPVDRRFPIAVRGWQAYLVVLGLFTLAARWLQGERPAADE